MFVNWLQYNRKPPCDTSECNRDMVAVLRLADVQVAEEKAISKLEGACEVLNLTPIFNKEKEEIRIVNKKEELLLWTKGDEFSYNIEDLTLKMVEKYEVENKR